MRLLREEDIPAVCALCEKNTLFYEYCPPFASRDSIREDMHALPPGKTMRDKYYIGYFDAGKLIAVMDFIVGFPDAKTAFLGFFMTEASLQKKGLGSRIIEDLCAYLSEVGFSSVRLGWVKGNPQAMHFWHKNGFRETGVSYDTEDYTVIVAQRQL